MVFGNPNILFSVLPTPLSDRFSLFYFYFFNEPRSFVGLSQCSNRQPYTFPLKGFTLTSVDRRELRLLNEHSLPVCLRFLLGSCRLRQLQKKKTSRPTVKTGESAFSRFPPQLNVIAFPLCLHVPIVCPEQFRKKPVCNILLTVSQPAGAVSLLPFPLKSLGLLSALCPCFSGQSSASTPPPPRFTFS